MRKEQFDITGMTCSACSARMEKSVAKLPGIQGGICQSVENSIVESCDKTAFDTGQIVQAVEMAGNGAISKTGQNRSSTERDAAFVSTEVLETAHSIDTVVLDRTSTISQSEPAANRLMMNTTSQAADCHAPGRLWRRKAIRRCSLPVPGDL